MQVESPISQATNREDWQGYGQQQQQSRQSYGQQQQEDRQKYASNYDSYYKGGGYYGGDIMLLLPQVATTIA